MVERTEHYGGGPGANTSAFVTVAADPPDPSAAPAMPVPRGLSRIGRYHVLETLGDAKRRAARVTPTVGGVVARF